MGERPIRAILATDCGSTTTKAILIARREDAWRLVARGEAPTTVEAPFDDVTIGVVNAVAELQEVTGRPMLRDGRLILGEGPDRGVDLYVSTSSAGGGLQMAVMGVVSTISAESAQRAALGAGAIIIDVFTFDDDRTEYQRVERIRHIRPDMVLLAGGTDGGTREHLVDMAESLLMAEPKPRFGSGFRLPVIYAANREAFDAVEDVLGGVCDLIPVDNVRPSMDNENLDPAAQAVHRVFLEHVMAQAPGYPRLMDWVSTSILPTPAAFGRCVQAAADRWNANVVAVDIGGATTDVFSVYSGRFTRTVSANYGMSYNISNVIREAGVEAVRRWVPFDVDETSLREMTLNKMIRPTTVPQTTGELILEQAIAREALRLSYGHHLQLAVGLKGIQQQRTMGDAFGQERAGERLIDRMRLDVIIGSGGALSHAPLRAQAAWMLLDAFEPRGVTDLFVDSIFMMPHLGVLAELHADIAMEVLHRDCLVPLGTAVVPVPAGRIRPGRRCGTVTVVSRGGSRTETAQWGGMIRFRGLDPEEEIEIRARPERGVDFGKGPGEEVVHATKAGIVGPIVDARGRPLVLPADDEERRRRLSSWAEALGVPSHG